ncbi:dolichyl-P-Man:Man(6)GlcNAc(2)-PP-dolichol alpha-1,2-mannosyltransferase [Martiniozyma asiatica (nom. inval.)]|nr:dolichyl-P-Man:Man(6)GlcNAc(2)-PP-dolichol alpha-1,2-mannosyltransferase [Martiniozyma asiatica]
MLQLFLYFALLCTRLHASIFAIIPDCDEVYNYWEPLNFLTRFFGKQTWEYSPEFAIRSYAYLLPFASLSYPLAFAQKLIGLNLTLPSYSLFYAVRITLAVLFTLAEIKLSKQLKFINGDGKMAFWFLIAQIFSPGMYQASISLLPSSFTLLTGILSTAYIVKFFHSRSLMIASDNDLANYEEEAKTQAKKSDDNDMEVEVVQFMMKTRVYAMLYTIITRQFTLAILLASIGGFAGWPFTMVLVVPFVVYALSTSIIAPKSVRLNDKFSVASLFTTYIFAGASCLFFSGFFVCQLDYLFYKRNVLYFFNIISYNVFHSDEATGPHIFGVEDALYYGKNLLLNFHVIFIIAAINMILLPTVKQLVIYKIPILIWCGIFLSQSHKEERFIYPIYHLIGISFAQFMSCPTFKWGFITKIFKFFINVIVLTTTATLFFTRIYNINNSYSAPMKIFKYLADSTEGSNKAETICLGREWYHYPSSFFLNENQRLSFTKSEFNGMLPSDFSEPALNKFEFLSLSTAKLPVGFNNKNQFNPDFVVDKSKCDYFIDITLETSAFDETCLDDWTIVKCEKMIDQSSSTGLERIIGLSEWLNDFIINPWLKLQQDLSVIELNRKLMEMYGLENPVGTKMFDGMYRRLNQYKALVEGKYAHAIGEKKYVKFCLAKK